MGGCGPSSFTSSLPPGHPLTPGNVFISMPQHKVAQPSFTRLRLTCCVWRAAQQAPAATQLTPGEGSAMSARFSPDGARLVFVSHQAAVASGTHGATATLGVISWPPAAAGWVCSPVLLFVVLRRCICHDGMQVLASGSTCQDISYVSRSGNCRGQQRLEPSWEIGIAIDASPFWGARFLG